MKYNDEKPLTCVLVILNTTFKRDPPMVASPVISALSSIVTTSLANTAPTEGVNTSADVICVDAEKLLAPKTPVKTGLATFALRLRALSTSALVYVLLPFIIMNVPSEVSETLPADFKKLMVVPFENRM